MKKLIVSFNEFSAALTVEMLSSLCESSCLATLEELDMCASNNYDSNEACSLLAQFIETATSLKKISIRGQRGERTVWLKITYAEEADGVFKQGCIKVVIIHN